MMNNGDDKDSYEGIASNDGGLTIFFPFRRQNF